MVELQLIVNGLLWKVIHKRAQAADVENVEGLRVRFVTTTVL